MTKAIWTRTVALGVVCLGALVSAQTKRVEAEFSYRFKATQGGGGVAPVVRLRNPGRALSGQLSITTPGRRVVQPLDLASGTTQTFDLPADYQEMGATVVLESNEGLIPLTGGENWGSPERPRYLVVGNDPGALSFLTDRSQPSLPPSSDWDDEPEPEAKSEPSVAARSLFDVRPEALPARASAYVAIDAVILSPEAQRISDEALSALKAAVLDGASLVLVGGAGATWWQDARLASLLPARLGPTPLTIDAGRLIDGLEGQAATLLALEPASDATPQVVGGVVTGVVRRYGRGSVAVTAFDPTASPFEVGPGRLTLFRGLVRVQKDFTSRSGQGRRGRWRSGSPGPASGTDPFQMRLPPANDVLAILVAYCLLVVPVNLLVLRKLGKPEWAWVTAPLLSAGAAGLLLARSSSLYREGEASSLTGEIVIAHGDTLGLVRGSSQVFYPNAGVHTLKLPGSDDVTMRSNFNMGMRTDEPVNVLDNGREVVATVRTSNLAFRTFEFRQLVRADKIMKVERLADDRLLVTNLGATSLLDVKVDSVDTLGTLTPYQSKDVVLSKRAAPDKPRRNPVYEDPSAGLATPGPDAWLVTARLPEAPFGVQFGRRLPGNPPFTVSYVMPRRESPTP